MNKFVKFMASSTGRGLRIIAGTGLIVLGIFGLSGTNGYILAGIGILPILTGLFNICLVAPFMGSSLSGSKL